MQMRIEDGWVVVTLGEFEIKVPAEDDSGADERIEITAAGRRLWVELVDGELIATEPEPVIDLSYHPKASNREQVVFDHWGRELSGDSDPLKSALLGDGE